MLFKDDNTHSNVQFLYTHVIYYQQEHYWALDERDYHINGGETWSQ